MNDVEMIDAITIKLDALLDKRGTDKCRAALEIVNMLAALRNGLAAEKRAEAQEAKPEADAEDGETLDGKTYKYGVIGGGE